MSDQHERLDVLVRRWREQRPGAFIPRFDPVSGGAGARVLTLMEAPGPTTVAMGAAAISSEDNPGPTAAAYRRARIDAGLPRDQVLRWNAVPWALQGPVRERDVIEAGPFLGELLAELTELRVVVCFGNAAVNAMMRQLTIEPVSRIVPVLAVPHPSPANARRVLEKQQRILTALTRAAALAADQSSSATTAP